MAAEENFDRSYQLFTEQKNIFLAELPQAETAVLEDREDAGEREAGGRSVLFAPRSWGKFEGGSPGVRYAFARYRDANTLIEHVLLTVDVDFPLKEEFREPFKVDMLSALRGEGVDLRGFSLWPHAGVGAARVLLEIRALMGPNAAKEVLRRYRQLGDFNRIAAALIRRYDERGCFAGRLQFEES